MGDEGKGGNVTVYRGGSRGASARPGPAGAVGAHSWVTLRALCLTADRSSMMSLVAEATEEAVVVTGPRDWHCVRYGRGCCWMVGRLCGTVWAVEGVEGRRRTNRTADRGGAGWSAEKTFSIFEVGCSIEEGGLEGQGSYDSDSG